MFSKTKTSITFAKILVHTHYTYILPAATADVESVGTMRSSYYVNIIIRK